MSISGASSSGVQGMNVFSGAIGSVSDNLANTSTVGYKRVDTHFLDLVNGSELTYRAPVTVQSRPIYRNDTLGPIATTGIQTNFAISSGQGFATVAKVLPSASGETLDTAQTYTQAGDFSFDGNGNLTNSGGYALLGVQESSPFSGSFPASASGAQLVPIKDASGAYGTMPGAASTTVNYNANFPADQPIVADPASGGPAANSAAAGDQTTTLQVYDSAGTAHTLSLSFRKTAANSWEVVGGAIQDTPPVSVVPSGGPYQSINFDSNGYLTSATTLSFSASGLSNGASISGLTLDLGGAPSTQGTSITGSTQWAGTSVEVRDTTDQTGHPSGTFESASIDSNGYVNFQYTNGLSAKPYRIPLTTFPNSDGLTRVTGATFGANPTVAGDGTQQWSGQNDAGSIDPGTVEQSNVDTATELTKLISAQQYFSSNSKVVSISNTMTQTAIDLKA